MTEFTPEPAVRWPGREKPSFDSAVAAYQAYHADAYAPGKYLDRYGKFDSEAVSSSQLAEEMKQKVQKFATEAGIGYGNALKEVMDAAEIQR